MEQELFRMDNTEGYSQEQLDALNQEWADKVMELGLETGTSEYREEAKSFSDEVSKR